MAKLEILQADYKTLSRTVIRLKRKGVLFWMYLGFGGVLNLVVRFQ